MPSSCLGHLRRIILSVVTKARDPVERTLDVIDNYDKWGWPTHLHDDALLGKLTMLRNYGLLDPTEITARARSRGTSAEVIARIEGLIVVAQAAPIPAPPRSAAERLAGYLRVKEARDPNTSVDRLRELAGDPLVPVRVFVARNSRTPEDVVTQILNDPSRTAGSNSSRR
jgi:hypothetical protein